MLEEEDEAVAEEEAHALQVDGRARHQLAGLVAVVEAERESEQLRVELVAHVELDAERLAAGDQPPAHHEERAGEPDGEDREDEPPAAPRDRRTRSRARARRRSGTRRRSRRPACRRRGGPRPRATTCTAAGSPAGGRRSCDSAVSRPRLERSHRPGAQSVASSSWIAATARSTSARFAGEFSQSETPDGCGSGIATAPSGELEPLADGPGERPLAEQPPDRERADGNDEPRAEQPELPVAPELAQVLLLGCRDAVALPGGASARIAPRDRAAIEGGVEGVLVHAEPAAERLPGPAAPRAPLEALVRARRLAVHVGGLPEVRVQDGERLERVPGLDAGTADGEVALERRERAVRRAAARQRARRVGGWRCRSNRCRTSRRAATARRSTRSARRSASHAELLDVHADEDHNRSVFTLVGEEKQLEDALVAGVATAKERIDLRRHEGAHPRIGAADVVPVVPIDRDDFPRARRVARLVGEAARRGARAAGVLLRRAGRRQRPVVLPARWARGAAASRRRRAR